MKFHIFLLFLLFFYVRAQLPIPCDLVWANVLAGEPLPETSVPTHGNQHYIANGGRVDNKTGIGYFPYGDNGYNTRTYYQILTNPNDCGIYWVQAGPGGTIDPADQRFLVQSSNGYVAKGLYENEYLAGLLSGDFFYIGVPRTDQIKRPGGSCQYLKSTIGLRLSLEDFQYENIMNDGEEDFLGFDLIENNSPVNVTHEVIHKKSFTNVVTLTSTNSFSQSSHLSVGIGIEIPEVGSLKLGFEVGSWDYSVDSVEVSHEEENEIVSTRSLHVPPYTSIQSCSIATIQTEFPLNYIAVGKFSIKGMRGSDVYSILSANGELPENARIEGNYVLGSIKGVSTVTVPMKSKFLIMNVDDPNGCKEIQSRISQIRRAQKFKNKSYTPEMISKMKNELKFIIKSGKSYSNY